MNEITEDEVKDYIKKEFSMTEKNFFTRRENDLGRLEYRLINVFSHFLHIEYKESVGFIYRVPFEKSHIAIVDDYDVFEEIKTMKDLARTLQGYQIHIHEILEDMLIGERNRLLDAYNERDHNNEIER